MLTFVQMIVLPCCSNTLLFSYASFIRSTRLLANRTRPWASARILRLSTNVESLTYTQPQFQNHSLTILYWKSWKISIIKRSTYSTSDLSAIQGGGGHGIRRGPDHVIKNYQCVFMIRILTMYDITSPLRFDCHSSSSPAADALPLFSCKINIIHVMSKLPGIYGI